LSEFKNLFDLNLNFEFLFKLAKIKEIVKTFFLSLRSPVSFRPSRLGSPVLPLIFFFINFPPTAIQHARPTPAFGPPRPTNPRHLLPRSRSPPPCISGCAAALLFHQLGSRASSTPMKWRCCPTAYPFPVPTVPFIFKMAEAIKDPPPPADDSTPRTARLLPPRAYKRHQELIVCLRSLFPHSVPPIRAWNSSPMRTEAAPPPFVVPGSKKSS
jgi:hypothetical protein